jgi:hypothetical protein
MQGMLLDTGCRCEPFNRNGDIDPGHLVRRSVTANPILLNQIFNLMHGDATVLDGFTPERNP